MAWTIALRCLSVLAVWAAAICAGGAQVSSLPPTGATAAPVPVAPVAQAEVVQRPGPGPSVVNYSGGKLEVIASGSGLNDILAQVSRIASIGVSGRVNDEPVFGTYGPASVGDVLSDLLDGTGTNMLLREPTGERAGTLILTPRSGGAAFNSTNFNAQPAAFTPYAPPRESYVRPAYQPPPAQAPGVPQSMVAPEAYVAPRPADAGRPESPAGGTSPASGPPSPEQIYQQLQRIQQAQPHP